MFCSDIRACHTNTDEGLSRLQRIEQDAWHMNMEKHQNTRGGVLYLYAGHRVPYFVAVKEPNRVKGLLYALGFSFII